MIIRVIATIGWCLCMLSVLPAAHAKPTVDAAVFANDHTYLFSSIGYYRLKNGIVEEGYPKLMNRWKGLPDTFLQGIDAALYNPKSKKLYFFKGNQYVRLSGRTVEKGYPAAIGKNWKGLPKKFRGNLDAAIFRAGHAYFFKDGEYVRFTATKSGQKMDAGYPKKLPGGWGLPAKYRGTLDAALSHPRFKKNYFFRDKQYVRLTDIKLDKGYPQSLKKWRGVLDEKRYKPSLDTIKIKSGFIIDQLNQAFKGTKLHLDNYDGDHHQTNWSNLTLPKQLFNSDKPKVIKFNIPEVKKEPFFYYVDNITSTGVKFGTHKDRITLRIDFESDGTEIPGRCFHNIVICVAGNNVTAPDAQWDGLYVEVRLKPEAKAGKVYLVDPKVLVGGSPQVQGICKIAKIDICNVITGYRTKLKKGLVETLARQISSKAIQERLATSIRDRILDRFKLQLIADIKLSGGQFVITHGFPDSDTLAGIKP